MWHATDGFILLGRVRQASRAIRNGCKTRHGFSHAWADLNSLRC